jgi:hypothetical protein
VHFAALETSFGSGACENLPVSIKRLGSEKNPSRTVQDLHQCGREAVRLLALELRVVDPEVFDEQWDHAVWVERALRSITGEYFEFVSAEELPTELGKFRGQADPLGYTMEWMSHARIFIAPRDVQSRVIAARDAWIKNNGTTFDVQQFEPYGKWFW